MTAGPKRVLSEFNAIAIIVGIVVGAGIFRLPSLVADQLATDWMIMGVWLLGGLVSLVGALCFAELVTSYPDAGGEYHILNRAYGRSLGFMFGWARMAVIQTGSIALLAYIFADYAVQILPLGPYGPAIYAVGITVLLTGLNIAGIRQAKFLQVLLFAATLVGLICVILTAWLLMSPAGPSAAPVTGSSQGSGLGGFGMAMVFVLLTYGGWNESAYISAEVRGGPRAMVRPMLLSLGMITLLYLLINHAYLRVLGAEGMAASQAVASDIMRQAFGDGGAVAISVLIMVVVAASINVTIFTGARTNFALGRDFQLFRVLDQWSDRRGAPTRALLVQGAIATAIVLLGALNRRGVETVIEYLSPVFWLFFLLIGIALFVLRRREPAAVRPFRVPLYPFTPLLFCLTSAYLLYSSLVYSGAGALVGVAVLALGLPLLIWAKHRQKRTVPADPRLILSSVPPE